MAEANQLQLELLAAQNSDGGWGYQAGSSWTEPTAFAMLALSAQSESGTAYKGGRAWLKAGQRPDGGWAPHRSVDTSTWVTNLALLSLPDDDLDWPGYKRGSDWSIRQLKPGMPAAERLVYRIRGLDPPLQPAGGSSWFPGTAAWIGPTVMSVLALSYAVKGPGEGEKYPLIRECQNYIMARR